MRKLYTMLVSMLCIGSMAFAASPSLNVSKTLQTGKVERTKKEMRIADNKLQLSGTKSTIMPTEKLAVKSIRKADANPSIEGLWLFDLGDYYFESSVGNTITVEFEATLQSGNQLMFEHPTGAELPFVGTYNETASTITFDRLYLGSTSGYYIYQEPFVYNYGTNELDPKTLIGKYSTYNGGIISFEADSGLSWAAYRNQNGTGTMAGYFSIYDLEGATKIADEEAEPLDEEQVGMWEPVGMATFVDAWILASYSMGGVQINPNDYAYEVELQQNVDDKNLYRLWKPYKTPGALVYDQGLNQSKFDGQIQFDISDPNHVVVIANDMPAGFKNNNGEFYLSNELGWYINYLGNEPGMKEFIIGMIYGEDAETEPDTYANGVVTIHTPMFDFSAAHTDGYSWNDNPYYSLIVFPEMPQEEDDYELIGTMSGYNDMNTGQEEEPDLAPNPVEVELYGKYEDGKLTITPMLNVNDAPVTFTIDLETGEAIAENTLIDVRNIEGDILQYAYGDLASKTPNLYGKIRNTGENTSELTIQPWGEMGDYDAVMPGFGWYFEVVYYNTVAKLNFAIPGLADQPELGDALVIDEDEVVVELSNTAPGNVVTQDITVSLQVEEPFIYTGYQFDITLPEFLSIGENGVKNLFGEAANVRPLSNADMYPDGIPANTYRVLSNFGENPTQQTSKIATITLTGTYTEGLQAGTDYQITIQNTVIFSDDEAMDIMGINGSVTPVELILNENNIVSFYVKNAELLYPSYMMEFTPNITVGENLGLTLSVTFNDDTETTVLENDIVEWTSSVEGIVMQFDPEIGNYIVNTAEASISGETNVTLNASIEDVVMDAPYTFTLRPIVQGDANDNGVVTVSDVVTVANRIADKDVARLDFPNANVIDAANNTLNGQDISGIVNIVMGRDVNEGLSARRRAGILMTNDRLVADNFRVVEGQQFNIGINLENTYDYSVIQAEVVIPEGMNVISVSNGPRASKHNLVYNILDNGNVKVVLYSPKNEAFADVEGSLLDLTVVASEECGDIVINSILAADADTNGYELGYDGGLNASVATGIEGIATDDAEGVRYFNTQGVEVKNPAQGDILIRVVNGKATKVVK